MSDAPHIFVLAGVNGAGKSSVTGSMIRSSGQNYFNPDEAAKAFRDHGHTPDDANSKAWQEGKERLEAAINNRSTYAFESTLGGETITRLLLEAAQGGMDVLVWFVGLATPEHHIRRVRARVGAGGHDIPETMIRQRWESSRKNIIQLMPHLAELMIFDNTAEGDPSRGIFPKPRLLLHMERGKVIEHDPAPPDWAKPILAAALPQ